MTTPQAVNLSLISHTNVGKTTLARTLLRRDIGEVRDAPHVTEVADAHTLVETPQGDVLRLWDTPGFGDSARLLKRLQASGNPIGWLLTQVWDRFTDRPFYSSQQAVRNVRDESDLILYLVNAAEDPASAGYVDAEMQILAWTGKPVVLLLNQVGPPRGHEADLAEATAWRHHVRAYPRVQAALALDAFARCWVQEDELLATVSALLPAGKSESLARLRETWRQRNLDVFNQSMHALAHHIALAAVDREPMPERNWKERISRWLSSVVAGKDRVDPEIERAMRALAGRVDQGIRTATTQLLELHGLSGRAADQVLARVAGQFDVNKPADVAKSGVMGGLVSGALGGLAADVAAGGLTFGAGALIGGLLGALGASGAARAYNAVRGEDEGSVGWAPTFLTQRVTAALLRYLAVAHFGRGRGEWTESEYPPHWRPVVERAVAGIGQRLEQLWEGSSEQDGASLEIQLQALLSDLARNVLEELYPSTSVFESGQNAVSRNRSEAVT